MLTEIAGDARTVAGQRQRPRPQARLRRHQRRRIPRATLAVEVRPGATPELRATNTWDALDAALHARGLLAAEERDALHSSYDFLREVEGRLHASWPQPFARRPAAEAGGPANAGGGWVSGRPGRRWPLLPRRTGATYNADQRDIFLPKLSSAPLNNVRFPDEASGEACLRQDKPGGSPVSVLGMACAACNSHDRGSSFSDSTSEAPLVSAQKRAESLSGWRPCTRTARAGGGGSSAGSGKRTRLGLRAALPPAPASPRAAAAYGNRRAYSRAKRSLRRLLQLPLSPSTG